MNRRQRHCCIRLLAIILPTIGLSGCGSASDSTPPQPVVVKTEPRSAYGNPPSYVVLGKRYYTLTSSRGFRQRGIASWYGKKFHGRKTSSQETYNMYAMTAAHKQLPLPTYVEVHNLRNGRKQVVRVNDRGPFHGDRIIDLSYAAAKTLGVVKRGTAMVEIRALPLEPHTTSAKSASPAREERENSGPYLQVGAFRSYRNALGLQQKLSAVVTQTVHISTQRTAAGTLHRVRISVDAEHDKSNLQQLIDAIAPLGLAQPYVISE